MANPLHIVRDLRLEPDATAAQRLTGSRVGLASNAFDIACGAVGGLLGALAWNGSAQRARVRASR